MRTRYLAATLVFALSAAIDARPSASITGGPAAAPAVEPQIRPEPNRGGEIDLASQDPKVALERFRPAPGYEVNLFASEKEFPEIADPLAMTFDTQGRLWVLTSPTYPHVLPGVPPKDKLVVLEDANRDGRADKLTVFADGLNIPMGFELGDGGVYVSQQPNLVFLRDTNGDGKADERRILLHGFGTEDSHHSIHAFTWGPGGELYFQEGTFLHSQVETPFGTVRLEEAGVFRYEPRTEKLSVFVSYGFANPWGHVHDRWGQNFISDASNGNNYYGTPFSGHVDYPRKQRPMQVWTTTQVRPTCGVEFISSRHFPEDAQGNFLVNNTIGFQGIKQYKVQEQGSGFVAVETEPLLMSTDPNFRPIALQFGPDGALYVGDWFNPLIGHMQYSLRDKRRDKTHGRIWRITAKGRPLNTPPKIHGEPIASQLELLKAYEDRTRYQARLALRAQPTAAVTAALPAWIAGLSPSDPDYEHHLLEALWIYQHHDVVEPALLKRLLAAKEFRARAGATRVLQRWFDRVDGSMALLKTMVNDPAPRVRLEAVRALSFVPTVEAAETALEALKHPLDYYLNYTLDSTITTLQKAWKPALTSDRPFAPNHPEGVAYALERLSPAELTALPRNIPVLNAMLGRPGIDAAARAEAVVALAKANGTQPIRELIAAIDRADGRPGASQVAADLTSLLLPREPSTLAGARQDLERLALRGRTESVRQGAFAALMRADGGVERAWQLASASPRSRIELFRGAARIEDAALTTELYPKLTALLSTPATQQPVPGVQGRYVRVMFPGMERTLRLVEVQVISGGRNIASSGKPTQSSVVAGGATGGQPERAIDGNASADSDAGSTAFTTLERDPWWELDLGSAHAIDAVEIRNVATNERSGGALVTVLDSGRQPVSLHDVATNVPAERIVLGGDFGGMVASAAILALSAIPGRDAERVALLAKHVESPDTREAAVAAIRRIPKENWPADQLGPLAQAIVTYIKSVPPAGRTNTSFKQAVEFGREIAARLPPEDAKRTTSAIDQLVVRTIRITAPIAAMKFDIANFTAEAGEEIEIEFVNPDHMPHNLVITVPGALESVSLKAEAMAKQPDAFARNFIPDTNEVLHFTKLINTGETARLRFTVPTRTGSYPYVCTFPGHWRTMNGLMQVVRPGNPQTLPGR